ncbi:pyridoxal 5'-phosphate synthase glutaminase subunit PdxT [Listeria ilorinensis]|uniref:pyridoxal 5'-phosphate synthase glutaminase subunit PdxT n=1 Tax=Listeria ilorinensis TaxID=2867439 RepID=UPI001EF6C28D|nr:pyridoxal 5'-phosphate synthase glutaminase subunit PdxT [Listeria ilorinensis]
MKIGVLGLQGAVSEHLRMIRQAGADAIIIKHPEELTAIDGLVLPGGESTTMRKLMKRYGFIQPIKDFHQAGKGIFGTCAGLVLSARSIEGGEETLDLVDYQAMRNGFGRQKESFEADLSIAGLSGDKFRAVFIRAPYIEKAGAGTEILAEVEGKIVALRSGHVLVTAFHPELTEDTRLIEFFIKNCL